MAINVNPIFAPNAPVPQVPNRPMPIVDQSAGQLGDIISKFAGYLDKRAQQGYENQMKQQQLDSESKLRDFQTRKLGTDLANQGMQNEAMRTLMDETVTPNTTQPIPENKPSSDVTAPELLNYNDPKYTFDAEKEATSDPAYGETLKHIKLATIGEGKPTEYYKAQKKLTDDVAQEKIKEEFSKQIKNAPISKDGLVSYQAARNVLMTIDPKGKIAPADANEMLKQFPDSIKQDQEARKIEQVDRQINQQGIANERAQKQIDETKAQNISTSISKVSDDMKDITPTINSLQSVKEGLDSAPGGITSDKFKNSFKALKAKISQEGNDQNILQGIAAYLIGFDPANKKARELKLWLTTDEGQNAVNSDEFRTVMIPVMGLLNNYTKTISGAAVSSGESLRTQGAFSVDPLSSPENLVASLKQIEKETRARTRNATSSLRRDNNAFQQYSDNGGLTEQNIPYLFGSNANKLNEKNNSAPLKDHSKDRDSRKSKNNPLGLKL